MHIEDTRAYLRKANQEYQQRATLLAKRRADHETRQDKFNSFVTAYKESLKEAEKQSAIIMESLRQVSEDLGAALNRKKHN